jgi:hypothetical protein
MDIHEDLILGKITISRYGLDLDLHLVAHALEDLPEDARHQAAEISNVPEKVSFRQRMVDELENACLDSYGNLERVPLLEFLSGYPVTPYTYEVSGTMSRGERPSPEKLRDLFERGHYRATVNLCAEMGHGDDPVIGRAGLTGELRTCHIPVVDMQPPDVAQVVRLLDLLSDPGAPRTYVHCEAGKGRTGVMTACYRMAVMGWGTGDALGEAERFGCIVPMQQAFIEEFGAMLEARFRARAGGGPAPGSALGRYPLRAPGSVRPTAQEETATITSVARQEAGGTR